jgi:hypothetical protein
MVCGPPTNSPRSCCKRRASFLDLPRSAEPSDIANYYPQNVIGVDTAFITVAKDISSFHTAVLEKLLTEIAQVGAQSRSG